MLTPKRKALILKFRQKWFDKSQVPIPDLKLIARTFTLLRQIKEVDKISIAETGSVYVHLTVRNKQFRIRLADHLPSEQVENKFDQFRIDLNWKWGDSFHHSPWQVVEAIIKRYGLNAPKELKADIRTACKRNEATRRNRLKAEAFE